MHILMVAFVEECHLDRTNAILSRLHFFNIKKRKTADEKNLNKVIQPFCAGVLLFKNIYIFSALSSWLPTLRGTAHQYS